MQYRIYTRAALESCGSRRWRARIGYTAEDGKRRNRCRLLSARGKKAARAEMEAWREEMELQALGTSSPEAARRGVLTVSDLVDGYIDMLRASSAVEPSTLAGYEDAAKRIRWRIGTTPLSEVGTASAQRFVALMVEDGYAPSTIRKDTNFLKSAATDGAERLGYWPAPPIGRVKTPKLRPPRPNYLENEMRARLMGFLSVADPTQVNAAIEIALLTGMREEEICGLRWRDVNLRTGTIDVVNVIGRVNSVTYYEKEPKSAAGRRQIPVTDELAGILMRRRSLMLEECMAEGASLGGNSYVVGSADGSYLKPHTLWRSWRALATSLGLVGSEGKIATFHDLRHTFATHAIASGADVKSVSSILGHANAAMTLNIYASADRHAKRAAMERINRELADLTLEGDYPVESFRTDRKG